MDSDLMALQACSIHITELERKFLCFEEAGLVTDSKQGILWWLP